jgi:glycosyltransferase involved in cell wall biosynthesis
MEISEAERQQLLARFGITKPFALYSGGADARKNLQRLIRAYARLVKSLRNTHQLVLAGKMSEGELANLRQTAKSAGINEGQLLFLGHVTDEELAQFYNLCTAFVFPSLHEGFGLPALEAMSCGAAVIGANTTSVPEVIGHPDALFDPNDEMAISQKLAQVLDDAAFRAKLVAHGLVQAKKFSWDKCAQRAIEAFEEIHEHLSPQKAASWAAIAVEQGNIQRQLINAIADAPQRPVSLPDRDLMETSVCIAINQRQTNRSIRARDLPESIAWRIEGPIDSSYSLALVNRETARALDALGHRVFLHSADGPGDLPINPDFLRANPDIARLCRQHQALSSVDADVTSRLLYPPFVADMDCRMNLLHQYAWEESGFPLEWADNFNEYLQGMTCLSRHVKKIMIDHGVTVPMSVCGAGIDHWERIKPDEQHQFSGKAFRFLHVSSCFPRKGADILLEAYGQMFTHSDDVTLIIKTFPNPHNEVHQWLADARTKRDDFPDVVIIEEDLTDAQLKFLYEQCHVLVAPSRAEGFGLPMAEAMLSGLAVITTGWGGQLDFCNEETAWLVDYSFEPAQTHIGLFDSIWAEPDVEHLAHMMRELYETPPALRSKRSGKGKQLLLEKFRWHDVVTRLVHSARSWSKMPALQQPRIGWVSTWNTRCGIATYSAHLVENMHGNVMILAARTGQPTEIDGPEVLRCWDAGENDTLDELARCIDDNNLDTLVVQFNYGFFKLEQFGHFLSEQMNAGRKVVLTMHSTTDPVHVPHKKLEKLQQVLVRCQRILVHSPRDLNRLKAMGLIENVTLFPHGILDNKLSSNANPQSTIITSTNSCFTITSYGFFLPHKGLLELIEAVALLRQNGQEVRLNLVNAEYPARDSAALIQKAKEKVSALGLSGCVQLTTDFLSDTESLSLLSEADLIVYPYQDTSESASGAVRFGLATGRPVAVTPLSIFDDVAPAVFTLPGQTPDQIAYGIAQLIREITDGSKNVQTKEAAAERWRVAHRYARLGRRLYCMLQAIAQQDCEPITESA